MTDSGAPGRGNKAAHGRGGPDLSLLRLLPPVLRARGFRLYTGGGGPGGDRGGSRLVDLWQEGGAAILGHTPPGRLRALKNAADRGLFAPFPHPAAGRFEKILSRLFPGRIIRVYTAAAAAALFPPAPEPFLPDLVPGEAGLRDPALSDRGGENGAAAALWRPFLEPGEPLALSPDAAPVLVPVLPGAAGLTIVAVDPAFDRPFPPPDPLPPVLLAAAARSVCDLIAAAPERGRLFTRVERALKGSPWRRRGIYLCRGETPAGAAHEGLFRRFLDRGFLLPPDPRLPAILPGELSPGEEAKLAELLTE
ncbi:MAG: hypothetical protein LBQ55_04750 [Treponema sp.]|jgi:hypothetical protein|nr:hypothetical protein [Treponema sp.]